MGTRVFIGRIPYHARERDIERFFKGYGKIREIVLKNGYGFVVGSFCINNHIWVINNRCRINFQAVIFKLQLMNVTLLLCIK